MYFVENDRKRKRDRAYDRDRRRDDRDRHYDRSRRDDRGGSSRRSYGEWDETPRFKDEPSTPDIRVKGNPMKNG